MIYTLYAYLIHVLAQIEPLRYMLAILYIYTTYQHTFLLIIPCIHLLLGLVTDRGWREYLSSEQISDDFIWVTKAIAGCSLLRAGFLITLYSSSYSLLVIIEDLFVSWLELYTICIAGWYSIHACEYAAYRLESEVDTD